MFFVQKLSFIVQNFSSPSSAASPVLEQRQSLQQTRSVVCNFGTLCLDPCNSTASISASWRLIFIFIILTITCVRAQSATGVGGTYGPVLHDDMEPQRGATVDSLEILDSHTESHSTPPFCLCELSCELTLFCCFSFVVVQNNKNKNKAPGS